MTFEQALPAVLGAAYTTARPVLFGGDNYDEGWHKEAERGSWTCARRRTPCRS